MRGLTKLILTLALVMLWAASTFAATKYVVTNDDNPAANSATFYSIGAGGKLTPKKVVKTGGTGLGGGFFATGRVNVLHDKVQSCVYVSDAGSNDVASINEATLKLVGRFKPSSTDSGAGFGIGLAANPNALYASFPASNTIATFKILPGCKLKFAKDTAAVALNGGAVDGMAIHGKILVVAYGDGSIQSFNISHGVAISNKDEQDSTGFASTLLPGGVDITKDGKFAIFGDIPVNAANTTIEVSNISTGKLTKTKVYGGASGSLGNGVNSNNVELSPDETLIYVSNNGNTAVGGTVTAAFFDKTTGKVSKGCISPVLKGFGTQWIFSGATALANNATGTGTQVYVAEGAFTGGSTSWIGVVNVTSNGKTCKLTESKNSFVPDAQSGSLLSIDSWPPRAF
jgi:hypothetical protein